MITRYRNPVPGQSGPSVYALMQGHVSDTRWCRADIPLHGMDYFESELERAGNCNVFKFLRPKHALLIVHDESSNEIMIVAREYAQATVTSVWLMSTYGLPHWQAFERLTVYLKNSGWLDTNPRLYNHWPLSLLANNMQRDYGEFIEQMESGDFTIQSWYGDKPTTFRQRMTVKFARARLYMLGNN